MFKTREIKTQILGEKLKEVRESLNFSLAQVSRKTKIPLRYIQYIEEGNYRDLPADIYVIAYLKKYASALNLEPEETTEQFKAERGISANIFKSAKKSKDPSYFIKKPVLVITPKRIGLIAAILLIALFFGYFWHQLNYLVNPPSLKITSPASDISTKDSSIEIIGHTDPDVHLVINGKELYVDEKGYFKGMVSLESGLNILKIEAKDRFGKINTVIKKIIVTN